MNEISLQNLLLPQRKRPYAEGQSEVLMFLDEIEKMGDSIDDILNVPVFDEAAEFPNPGVINDNIDDNNGNIPCKRLCCKGFQTESFITLSDMHDIKNELLNELTSQMDFYFGGLTREITKMSSKIDSVNDKVENLSKYVKLGKCQNYYSFERFTEDCNLRFPLNSEDEFAQFNELISNNSRNIREKLTRLFKSLINPDVRLLDIVRNLIKKFFGKASLINYVAQKALTNTKKVFKDTAFYRVFEEGIIEAFKTAIVKLEEDKPRLEWTVYAKLSKQYKMDDYSKAIMKCVSTVLSGVSDWDGGKQDKILKLKQRNSNGNSNNNNNNSFNSSA